MTRETKRGWELHHSQDAGKATLCQAGVGSWCGFQPENRDRPDPQKAQRAKALGGVWMPTLSEDSHSFLPFLSFGEAEALY